jgi:hypothetical protein
MIVKQVPLTKTMAVGELKTINQNGTFFLSDGSFPLG